MFTFVSSLPSSHHAHKHIPLPNVTIERLMRTKASREEKFCHIDTCIVLSVREIEIEIITGNAQNVKTRIRKTTTYRFNELRKRKYLSPFRKPKNIAFCRQQIHTEFYFRAYLFMPHIKGVMLIGRNNQLTFFSSVLSVVHVNPMHTHIPFIDSM